MATSPDVHRKPSQRALSAISAGASLRECKRLGTRVQASGYEGDYPWIHELNWMGIGMAKFTYVKGLLCSAAVAGILIITSYFYMSGKTFYSASIR